MLIKPILLSKKFLLPNIELDDTKLFLHHYNEKMELYIKELSSLPQSAFIDTDKAKFISRLKFIIENLKITLSTYLDGHPAKAYKLFKEMIENADPNLSTELIYARTTTINSDSIFYRVQKEYRPLKTFKGIKNGFSQVKNNIDLFHVPFQNRKNIGTTRYSIPGFPCLYLAGSIHTSWSECSLKDRDLFHAISFKNHRPLYLVDLVPLNFIIQENGGEIPDILYNKSDKNKIIIDYTYLFPLIFACHSKYKYNSKFTGEIQFKSEYIIPQLLLQWYRDQKLIVDGIRYLSSTSEDTFPTQSFCKYNYVIPVTKCVDSGWCNDLLINFSSTDVYSHVSNKSKQVMIDVLNNIESSLNKSLFSPL